MIAPARRAAYDVLRAVEAGSADLPAALARVRTRLDDPRDRALAAEIATGTLRWRGRLDWLIERATRRSLARLDPEVLDILRLGLYQLLFLDRVPASAAVDDAVALTRTAGKRSAAGFVNGVLRGLSRRRRHLDLPARPATASGPQRERALDFLSITGSHPRWLAERWLDRYGLDAAAEWVAFNNAEAPVTLRASRLHGSRERLASWLSEAGVRTRPTRFAPDGLVVVEGHPLGDKSLDAGRFVVQDEASQLVTLMAGASPGQHVYDACAAPGGKSLALADALAGRGLLVAADVRPRRVALLRRLLKAGGAGGVPVVQADLERGAPFGAVFDRVLVDAPCSGLGTIRRDPEVRWRRMESDIAAYADRQRRMIAEAARTVRPGGRLVYATCSSEPDENGAVVEAFLSSHPSFSIVPAARLIAEGVPPAVLTASGLFETRPDLHGLEAFFAVALEQT